MGFTKDKMLITVKHFWVKSRDAQPCSCLVSETGCSMLLGEAVQAGLTCALLLKRRDHMVLKLCGFFFFLIRCPMGNQISTLQRKENKVTLISNMPFQRLLSGFSEIFKFPSGIKLCFL